MSFSDRKNPVISVIVPVYNAAPYLDDCISSVLQQTYDSFELILVDDGSTDDSQKTAMKWCESDNRVCFISCPEHRGISHARNKGIEKASGTYLFFLDSDDCLHPQLLAQMVRQAERTQADLTKVEYVTSTEMEEKSWKEYCTGPYQPEWILSMGEAVWDLWCKIRGRDSVRQTMFLRESVKDLRFDESVSIAEDAQFNYDFMTAFPRKVTYSETPGYYYRIRQDSITKHVSLERLMTWCGVKFKIRDQELSLGRTNYAAVLERENLLRMRSWISDNASEKEAVKTVQKRLKEEMGHPMFRTLSLYQRFKIFLVCSFLPVYNILVKTRKKFVN